MHVVTGVKTQGRFGNGRGAEFTEAYKLHYWRPGMTDFIEYRDSLGRTVCPIRSPNFLLKQKFIVKPPISADQEFLGVKLPVFLL